MEHIATARAGIWRASLIPVPLPTGNTAFWRLFGRVRVYGYGYEEPSMHPSSTPELSPLGSDFTMFERIQSFFPMLYTNIYRGYTSECCGLREYIWLSSFVNLELCILSYHPKQIPSIFLIPRLWWNGTLQLDFPATHWLCGTHPLGMDGSEKMGVRSVQS